MWKATATSNKIDTNAETCDNIFVALDKDANNIAKSKNKSFNKESRNTERKRRIGLSEETFLILSYALRFFSELIVHLLERGFNYVLSD